MSSTSDVEDVTTRANSPSTLPSSPAFDNMAPSSTFVEQQRLNEERKARTENTRTEAKRLAARRKRKINLSPHERAQKAKELDRLLSKSEVFSDILTSKTKALGRVGRDFDNKKLADAGLELMTQPKNMVGGTMRDYQLEGLTWLYEICVQGLSGILADEMGLGKTIQVISLLSQLHGEGSFGPYLVIAPLSTLSNWQSEFAKWTPSIPFILYHGTIQERQEMFKTKLWNNYPLARSNPKNPHERAPNKRFPVVCTSYEMVLRDHANLSKVEWSIIVVDEGHRMKNADAKLFRELQQFGSLSRLLITGTPLQNNLKELWSLLHFLHPNIFLDWEAFEVWFDFSDLQDEKTAAEFVENSESQTLVAKIHKILQPLLLRRIKADVASYLPKKREYVLYAPMTKEQTDLYNVVSDKKADTRSYLENKVVEQLTETYNTPKASRRSSRQSSRTASVTPAEKPSAKLSSMNNAFAMMMKPKGKASEDSKSLTPATTPVTPATRSSSKRKTSPLSETSVSKSAKSSRQSTPSATTCGRGRPRKNRASYTTSDDVDDDKMDDDAFEEMLVKELEEANDDSDEELMDAVDIERAETLEKARLQIGDKRLGNPMMQLRLVCNSPHNFYNPWAYENDVPVDESIVTSSGKMLLLDRLLPELFSRGHKVLIFSQFKTQLDILHDYCAELRGWNVCRLDGGVAQEDRRQQIEVFNKDPDFKVFLLSTRAGGQGINLASADTVILFDSDFNPQQDLQAQDRCHRIGQTRPVIVYRFATNGTVEDGLLMSAESKRRLEKLVIQKTKGQKLDANGDINTIDKAALRALLLKDGEVYKHSGGVEILSDEDLEILCDRSDAAFDRAARGAGNAAGFQVVETAADRITQVKS
ncbi:SNF2 family N-terminal domain-containing protein [Xylariaceae sp. FL0255]|nr:SNF2 family N-terminal domain-containing protein [Xylariaceae sp. FL0255]